MQFDRSNNRYKNNLNVVHDVHENSHRLPELWWTDKANYSEWAEEMIGMREILIKFANGGAANKGILSRDNILGMRAPYVKPGMSSIDDKWFPTTKHNEWQVIL